MKQQQKETYRVYDALDPAKRWNLQSLLVGQKNPVGEWEIVFAWDDSEKTKPVDERRPFVEIKASSYSKAVKIYVKRCLRKRKNSALKRTPKKCELYDPERIFKHATEYDTERFIRSRDDRFYGFLKRGLRQLTLEEAVSVVSFYKEEYERQKSAYETLMLDKLGFKIDESPMGGISRLMNSETEENQKTERFLWDHAREKRQRDDAARHYYDMRWALLKAVMCEPALQKELTARTPYEKWKGKCYHTVAYKALCDMARQYPDWKLSDEKSKATVQIEEDTVKRLNRLLGNKGSGGGSAPKN